jgi:hypothetical protein
MGQKDFCITLLYNVKGVIVRYRRNANVQWSVGDAETYSDIMPVSAIAADSPADSTDGTAPAFEVKAAGAGIDGPASMLPSAGPDRFSCVGETQSASSSASIMSSTSSGRRPGTSRSSKRRFQS